MNTPRNGNAVFEWLLLFGLTAIAIVLTKLLGLRGRWSDAVIYTVVVFTVVIQMLRPAWDRPILWLSLSLTFCPSCNRNPYRRRGHAEKLAWYTRASHDDRGRDRRPGSRRATLEKGGTTRP
jgi:hypothetical protein